MPTIAEIAAWMESIAPPARAAAWDNVGLLLGDPASPVERVLTCLTLTPAVADEASRDGVQLIVTHHPILFKGVKRLTTDTPEGRSLLGLARAGVAVYSPHTAYDDAAGGINDRLAELLGLVEVRPLRGHDLRECKIVVFVPESDLQAVANAMFAAGAGVIGEYDQCSYRLLGTGTFRGSAASNPTIGQPGQFEQVQEYRLEMVCPESAVSAVVRAMRAAHSYEEPAFDVYPLVPQRHRGGTGRIGRLATPTPLGQLARAVRQALGAGPVAYVGAADRPISRVAIGCGAADELLTDAIQAQADCFLTGELRFHYALAAEQAGVAVVVTGHYASERHGIEALAQRLAHAFPSVRVAASASERDPFAWV
jgi:dinuclear metal center YbgI/SA1388 family protein